MGSNGEYRDGSLYVSEDTDVEEVIEWVQRCVDEPFHHDGKTVWNFSSHKVDEEALEEKLERLHRDEFIIPFQVGGAWAMMYHLLPDRLRRAEVLTYDSRYNEYKAYRNFYRELERSRIDRLQHDLKNRAYERLQEVRETAQYE